MARQHGKEAGWVTGLAPQLDAPLVSDLRVVPATVGRGLGVELKTPAGSVWLAVNWQPGQPLQAGPISTTEKAATQP